MGFIGGPIDFFKLMSEVGSRNNNCYPSYAFEINCFRNHITSVGARNLISLKRAQLKYNKNL